MMRWLKTRQVTAGAMILCTCLGAGVDAARVRLAWDAPTHNEDGSPIEDVCGYKIYYGTQSGAYDAYVSVGATNHVTIEGMVEGRTYYFCGQAVNAYGNESALCPKTVFTLTDDVPPAFESGPVPAQAFA